MPVTFIKLGQFGRLGNQLFQIASTIGTALSNNDTFLFPKWKYQNDFNISEHHFIDAKFIKYSNTYEEPHFHYDAIPYKKSLNLHGYLQSKYYWKDYEDKIKIYLTPRVDKYHHEYFDGASIHVRRGDYLIHQGCYHILSMENYYEKAMETMNASKYLVFSDSSDMTWCKQHFKGNQFEFAEGNYEVLDLHLMTRCLEGNIIANSSFSWWGAYLRFKSDAKVIAPKIWFGPKLSSTHNTKDLCPPEWIKI